MEAHGEVSRPVRPVRHLFQQQLLEPRIGRVGVDHRHDHGTHELVQRGCGMLQQFGFDHAIDFFDVALVQCDKNCSFIREILVDRSDAYPRNLGNAVCSHSIAADLG